MESCTASPQPKARGLQSIVDALLDAPRHITPIRFIVFVVTLVLYNFVLGWKTALILIVSLYIHESGHLWAAKRLGVETLGLVLTPLGAIGFVRDISPSHSKEVFMSIMGPAWGLFPALILAIISYLTSSPYFAATSAVICGINVFNLLPINPLDGGRIMKAVAYSLGKRTGLATLIAGPVITLVLFFCFPHPLLVIVGVFSFHSIKGENNAQQKLEPMSQREIRKTSGFNSLILLSFLALGYLMLLSLGDSSLFAVLNSTR